MSCQPSGFNPSTVGCCPFPSSISCGGYTCCPSDTTCVHTGGSGYGETFNCVKGGVVQETAASVCKGGPPLPMSRAKKNVIWIGDSLSLGMIPFVTANLSDIALVQHAPWGGDGGAEETTYGLRCLQTFLASPSGMDISPDVIIFNWVRTGWRVCVCEAMRVCVCRCGEMRGLNHPPYSPTPPPLKGMHDGPMTNDTTPGQNAPPTAYGGELKQLTEMLQAFAAPLGAKLVFAHTTPYICTAQQDGCVQNLNNVADSIMAAAGIPVLKTYEAVIAECGHAPQASCFNLKGCWCVARAGEQVDDLVESLTSPRP